MDKEIIKEAARTAAFGLTMIVVIYSMLAM